MPRTGCWSCAIRTDTTADRAVHDERGCARALLSCVFLLALAGCGGGGSSGDGSTATRDFPSAPVGDDPDPPENLAPTATFTTTQDDESLGVDFDASDSADPDGEIVRHFWEFDDGSTALGERVRHDFPEAGTHEVRLTVTDDDDDAAFTVRSIEVRAPRFVMSGTIQVRTASFMDGDTNDPRARLVPNDDFDRAQPVSNPAIVGGYLAAAGTGSEGATSGDRADVYRFHAGGGEIIHLDIAAAGADLDLRLYDESRAQIDQSIGIQSRETVGPLPEAGPYFLEVTLFGNAASNYRLSIGDERALPLAPAAFVPGEALSVPAGGREDPTSIPAPGILRIDDPAAHAPRPLAGAAPLGALAAERIGTLAAIKKLHNSGDHDRLEPNWIRQPLQVPSDPRFANQWHHQVINLPAAWDVTTGSRDVVVAVIDSGIVSAHPEFTDPEDPASTQLVAGHDFISDPDNALDGDGVDSDPEDPGSSRLGSSLAFHGTHVAGTVGARTAGPDEVGTGTAGAAWQVQLMPLRVLGLHGGTSADLIQALRYAGGLDNTSGRTPEQPADIVNLSLGSTGFSAAEQETLDALRARGILVIAAAGNTGSDVPTYPAAYDNVISVAATTISSERASYSSTGATIDVAAPGGDLGTDSDGDGFADGVLGPSARDADGDPDTPPVPELRVLAGTSMAAPHVTGVAVLMKAIHPELAPEEFEQLLAAGRLTRDLGAPGRDDHFGHGLIDARRAVLAAIELSGGAGEPISFLTAHPDRLEFGAFSDTLEFRTANVGNGPLIVDAPVTDVPWLSVTALDADPTTGLGRYRARVDRDRLPDEGVFRGSIRFESDANPLTLGVRVQRTEEDLFPDTGHMHVLLLDDSGETARFETDLDTDRGSYTFRFEGVPAGRYLLVAGSDSDNDGFICDAGESCGVYPTLGLAEPIHLTEGMAGLDFVTTFPQFTPGLESSPDGGPADDDSVDEIPRLPDRPDEGETR